MALILRWLINALGLYIATLLVPGITAPGGWPALLIVALIFGLLNALIRPLIKILTCPLIALTLGLFTLVINGLMLLLTSWLAQELAIGFNVAGFVPAFVGALIITVISFVLSLLIRD
jgi:putative membrane protein